MSWVILVKRKLVGLQICGSFDYDYTARTVERQRAREVRVKTTDVANGGSMN